MKKITDSRGIEVLSPEDKPKELHRLVLELNLAFEPPWSVLGVTGDQPERFYVLLQKLNDVAISMCLDQINEDIYND